MANSSDLLFNMIQQYQTIETMAAASASNDKASGNGTTMWRND